MEEAERNRHPANGRGGPRASGAARPSARHRADVGGRSRGFALYGALLPLCLLASRQAAAESAGEDLPTLVVTATRTAKVESEAPASVSVVSAREIETKHARRLDEALRGTPGVFTRGLDGGQPSSWQNQITLRGVPGYYRTGVLLDGLPLNNAFSGGVNLSMVPMEEIQQIEIVPGPFSSLYGGAGMAGVVNIITKSPQKRELSLSGEGGSHDSRSLSLGYRDKFENGIALSLSYGHQQADGYVREYVTKTPTGSGGTPVSGWEKSRTGTGGVTYIVGDKGEQPWEQDNFGARLYLTPAENARLILSASYLSSDARGAEGRSYLSAAGIPFPSGSAQIDGNSTTLRATDFLRAGNGEDVTRYAISYEAPLGETMRLNANLGYQENAYWYTSIKPALSDTRGAGSLSDIPALSVTGDVHLGLPLGERHYLLLGLSGSRSRLHKKVYALDDWRHEQDKGELGDYANGYSRLFAIYAQDEIDLSSRLTAYLGARYDRWSTHGDIFINGGLNHYRGRSRSAFSPKISLVYDLARNTLLKGALGRAFRAPNLSDMYSTFGSSTIYWSNPDLEPERVTTAELTLEHSFPDKTKLRATCYRSRFSNLIYTTTSGSDRYRRNTGEANSRGLDLELRHPLTQTLNAFVNATWVDTEITDNDARPESVGKRIPLQAGRIANIGLDGTGGAWSGSLIGSYSGKIYSRDDNSDRVNGVVGSHDPYFKLNGKLSYRFSDRLSASLAVDNLLDRSYYTGTFLADGRSYHASFSARF